MVMVEDDENDNDDDHIIDHLPRSLARDRKQAKSAPRWGAENKHKSD